MPEPEIDDSERAITLEQRGATRSAESPLHRLQDDRPQGRATRRGGSPKVTLKWKERSDKDRHSVTGKDCQEVRAALNSLARGEWGYTDWSFDSESKTVDGTVTAITLTPSWKISMPTWLAYKEQPPQVKHGWDRMYKALYAHEQGHVRIVEEWVTQLVQELESLGRVGLEAVKAKIDDITSRHAKAQEAYDDTTRHGINQGVGLACP